MPSRKDFGIVNNDVWIAAYVHGNIECFELRTGDREKEHGFVSLWHEEKSIGTALPDVIYEDLGRMDLHLREIETYIDLINHHINAAGSLEKLAMIVGSWLRVSPIFAPFAALVQKVFVDWNNKREIDITPIRMIVEQYHLLQQQMRVVAESCFATEEQENMAKRYLKLYSEYPVDYPLLSYGRIHMETVPIGQKVPHIYARSDELISKANIEGELIPAEVLQTDNLSDLTGFLLCKYLAANVRFRHCKYCGKYFGITGNYKGDYCDRLMNDSFKTCKEGGALRLYEMRKLDEPAIREYKRSYKAHNARIRYKAMTREEFNAWSIEARKRRDQCLAGEISLQEFVAWLDSDKR